MDLQSSMCHLQRLEKPYIGNPGLRVSGESEIEIEDCPALPTYPIKRQRQYPISRLTNPD